MRFSFRRDWRAVDWGDTLKLHLTRCVAAAVIWSIVSLFAGSSISPGTVLIGLPVFYAFMVPVYLVVTKIITGFMGEDIGGLVMGVMTLIFIIGIAVGDPLLYALRRRWPHLTPVERFGFVNFTVFMFVLDPAKRLQPA
jgi:hypothetical protein